ncbi:MAG TPA: insulinase family protein, partial [bacterium]|nr:insulinase family protein [bacterium]
SGGMSSRLFYEVRELRGLVYDIMTSNSSFSDTGFFYVSASTRPDNLAEVLDVTISELNKVASGEVSQQELDRVKSQLKVSITMSMESVGGRMSKLAQSEIFYGRNVTDEEILEKILEVKPEDVCELAAEVFRADRAVFSGLGPYKGRKAAAAERLALDSISKLSR